MTELLLIFLGAAYLENLVLLVFFDAGIDTSAKPAYGIFGVAGLLLVLAAALDEIPHSWQTPPQATAYLHALAFMTIAITVAQGIGTSAAWFRESRWRRLRMHLPVLVANLAVLAFSLLDARRGHDLGETAGFCIGASFAFYAAMISFSSLRDRLEAADVPKALSGLPITVLTAGLMSLAVMGLAGSLP